MVVQIRPALEGVRAQRQRLSLSVVSRYFVSRSQATLMPRESCQGGPVAPVPP